jgi:hypothetical protein
MIMYRSLHPTLISLAAGYVFVAEKLVAAAQRMVLGVHLEWAWSWTKSLELG